MEIIKYYLTNSDCYKAGKKITKVKGIVKHSTGANNPNLVRYIGTHKLLGTNQYNNHWNRSGVSKMVHFMIGKDKDGKVRCFQLLPLNYRCWGCASGKQGSYNNTHIQYEICEDGLNDKEYYAEAFKVARELDAYLCKELGLDPSSIVSHQEAYKKGYASNHADCDHWLKKFDGSMDKERAAVERMLKENPYPEPTRELSRGCEGDDVKWVQYAVGAEEDGKFGPDTEKAVIAFQEAHPELKIKRKGVVGKKTIKALVA